MNSETPMSPPGMSSPDTNIMPRRSTWPTAIGIVGIIFGSMGLLGGFCGVFAGIFLKSFLESLEGSMSPEEMAQMMSAVPTGSFIVITGIVGLFLGILQLVGSIGLLKRRSSSRNYLNLYATLAFAWLIFSVIWSVMVVFPEMQNAIDAIAEAQVQEREQAQHNQGEGSEAGHSGVNQDPYFGPTLTQPQISPIIGEAVGSIFPLAWYAIVLFFMNAPKYRAEINSWGD